MNGRLGTNFGQILIEIDSFPFKKMDLKGRLQSVGHFGSPQCVK